MTQNIIGGPVSININGVIISTSGEFTWELGGQINTPQLDGRGNVVGVSVEFKAGKVKGKIYDAPTLDVAALVAMTDGQVVIGAPNGKQILVNPAAQTGSGEVSSAKGEIDVEFQGPITELMPS